RRGPLCRAGARLHRAGFRSPGQPRRADPDRGFLQLRLPPLPDVSRRAVRGSAGRDRGGPGPVRDDPDPPYRIGGAKRRPRRALRGRAGQVLGNARHAVLLAGQIPDLGLRRAAHQARRREPGAGHAGLRAVSGIRPDRSGDRRGAARVRPSRADRHADLLHQRPESAGLPGNRGSEHLVMTDIIIDGHQDIAWNHFNHGRDFTRSAWATRRRETGSAVAQVYGPCMVGLPDAILGRIAVMCATIFVPPASSKMVPTDRLVYATSDEAYRLGTQQIDYYHRLAGENDRIDLILNRADLDAVLATWAPGTDFADHRLGLVLLMEGADPILEPAQVEEWHARGLRI